MAILANPDNAAPRSLRVLIGASAAAGLIALVGTWEGRSEDPYRDIVGVWTVCYGDTRAPMHRYTPAQCRALLADRLVDYAGPVLARNPELAGHDDQLIAASSLAYNIGVSRYRRSTVARLFSAGDWPGACDAFLAWNRAGGREVVGLTNRRRAERAVCRRGLRR